MFSLQQQQRGGTGMPMLSLQQPTSTTSGPSSLSSLLQLSLENGGGGGANAGSSTTAIIQGLQQQQQRATSTTGTAFLSAATVPGRSALSATGAPSAQAHLGLMMPSASLPRASSLSMGAAPVTMTTAAPYGSVPRAQSLWTSRASMDPTANASTHHPATATTAGGAGSTLLQQLDAMRAGSVFSAAAPPSALGYGAATTTSAYPQQHQPSSFGAGVNVGMNISAASHVNLDTVRAEHTKLLNTQAALDVEEKQLEEETQALYARLAQLSMAHADLENTDMAIRAEWDAVYNEERKLDMEPMPDLTPAIHEAEGRIAIAQAKFQQASDRLNLLESQLPVAEQIERRKAQQAKEVEDLQATLQLLENRRRSAIVILERFTDAENARHRELSRAMSLFDFDDNVVKQQAAAANAKLLQQQQQQQQAQQQQHEAFYGASAAPSMPRPPVPSTAAPSRATSLAPRSENVPTTMRAKSVSFAPPSANIATTVSEEMALKSQSRAQSTRSLTAGDVEDEVLAGVVASRAASQFPMAQQGNGKVGFTDFTDMLNGGAFDGGVSIVLDAAGTAPSATSRANSVSNLLDTKRRRTEVKSVPSATAMMDFGGDGHSVALDLY